MELAEAIGLQKGPKTQKRGKRPPTTALCKSYTFWRKVPKYTSMFQSPVKYVLGVKRPLFRGIKITLNLLKIVEDYFSPMEDKLNFVQEYKPVTQY